MIHSNSEGDIYIEEMPLLLVHLREEEKGADARLSEVLSYALDGYAYETATEISAFEDYVNRWRRLEKTQNRKNPVQGRILFAVPLGTSGINLELYRLIRFLREHPDFLNGFVGGLLEHTLSVVKMCDYFSKQYPLINRDLLLTAAMFHDIGKTKELSAFPANDYTDDGQLLGHIIIGSQMVKERIDAMPGFPKKLESELIHCILAHHGELEYGSPKKPALIEAMALNLADNADARMETMTEVLRGAGDNMGWLGYNRFMETNVRRTSEE